MAEYFQVMSWPATPVRAKRGRSVNSVRATQLKSALAEK